MAEDKTALVDEAIRKDNTGEDNTKEREQMRSPEVDSYLNSINDPADEPLEGELSDEEMDSYEDLINSGEDVRITDPQSSLKAPGDDAVAHSLAQINRTPASDDPEIAAYDAMMGGQKGAIDKEQDEKDSIETAEQTKSFVENYIEPTYNDAKKLDAPEIGKAIVGGALDSVEGVINLAADTGEAITEFLSSEPEELNWNVEFAEGLVPPSPNKAAQMIRGITEYVVPYGGAMKVASKFKKFQQMGTAGKVGVGIAAGGLVSASTVDIENGNLSNLILENQNHAPDLIVYAAEMLAHEEDDADLTKRVKNGVEAILFDVGATVSFGLAAKAVVGSWRAAKAGKALIKKGSDGAKKAAAAEAAEATAKAAAKTADGVADGGPTIAAASDPQAAGKPKPSVDDAGKERIKRFSALADEHRVEKIAEGMEDAGTLKEIIAATDAKIEGEFIGKINANTKGGVRPDAEVLASALALIKDKKKVAKLLRMPVDRMVDHEIKALGMMATAHMLKVKALIKAAGGAKKMSKEQMLIAQELLGRATYLANKFSSANTGSGRQLRAANQAVSEAADEGVQLRIIDTMSDLLNKDGKLEHQMAMLEDAFNKVEPGRMMQIVFSMGRASGNAFDIATQGFFEGVFALKTVVQNTAGIPTGIAAEFLNTAFVKGIGKEGRREAAHFYQALKAGHQKGVTAVKEYTKNGEILEGFAKYQDIVPAYDPDRLGVSKESFLYAGMKKMAAVSAGGLKIQNATDLYANMTMGLAIQSKRLRLRAIELGLEEGTEGFTKYMQEGMSTMDSAIAKDAMDSSRAYTLTRGWEELTFGSVMGPLNTAAQRAFPMGNALLAFLKAGNNAVDYGIRHLPGLHRFSPTSQKAMEKGGRAWADAQARANLGTFLLMGGAYLSYEGVLTGGIADFETERALDAGDAGKQEFSLQIGDTNMSLRYLSIPLLPLFIGADIAKIFSAVEDDQSDEAISYVETMTHTMAKYLTPNSISEYADFFGMINDLKEGKQMGTAAAEVGGRFVETALPFASTRKSVTTARLAGEPKRVTSPDDPNAMMAVKIYQKMRNEMMVQLFGENKLPVARNIFGLSVSMPVGLGPSNMSPIFRSPVLTTAKGKPNSKVYDEFRKLKLADPFLRLSGEDKNDFLQLDMPDKYIKDSDGFAIRLTPKEYEQRVKLSAGLDLPTAQVSMLSSYTSAMGAGLSMSELRNATETASPLVLYFEKQIERGWPGVKRMYGTSKPSDLQKIDFIHDQIDAFRNIGTITLKMKNERLNRINLEGKIKREGKLERNTAPLERALDRSQR